MANLQLIIGLGNPGSDYAATRHNAGWWYVEQLARDNNIPLKPENKFFGLCGRGMIAGHDIRLLIPTTFMNKSGQAVAALAQFYKIAPENMLVAHDELDIAPGTARFKTGGGHGGHNGLRDIITSLGNTKNFHRLRIGIGHPGDSKLVSGYVLNRASLNDQELIERAIDEAVRYTPEAIEQNWSAAMNQLHSFKAS